MAKKRVLFASNYCGIRTGFGGFMREILTYLYKTGKYELGLFAAGMSWEHDDFARWPWKTFGTLPTDPVSINAINRDPNLQRSANYGSMLADKVVNTFRPDVFISVEDIWGSEVFKGKNWWGKIPSVVHTTLDSRPIYPMAVEMAKSTPYFFSWADFATKEMQAMGISNAKTLRGTVNTNVFRKLSEEKRRALRLANNIPEDAYCFGMLSRNQLRKSFPNIIKAYSLFKQKNPSVVTRLLFFTHYGEGWNIPDLCKEMGVNQNEVLATYKCRKTGQYFVMPFAGQDINNPNTGDEKSLVTVNVSDGLTDEEVNEWYNLLDVYIHAFTSGGQERSIQEAKLTELITLVTNYSCGEDSCQGDAASLPLAYDEYREPGTQFIKATTRPDSIVENLETVLGMSLTERAEWGRKARQWVLDNFSIEVIGAQFEALIDGMPDSSYDFDKKESSNPEASIQPLENNVEWLKHLYKEILHSDITDDNQGLLYWVQELSKGASRSDIENYFRQVALKNTSPDKLAITNLGSEPPCQRLLINMPESLGDILYLSCLLESARRLYPHKTIYVSTKPQYQEAIAHLEGKFFDKWLPWRQDFDQSYALEGRGGEEKVFEIILNPHILTQRFPNLSHCHADKHDFDLGHTNSSKSARIR